MADIAKALIDAAEATVVIRHPEPGYEVVGFKIRSDKRPCASLIAAFNEMVDRAEAASHTAGKQT